MKPEEQSIGGKSIRPRPDARPATQDLAAADIEARVGQDGHAEAPEGTSSLEQTQWVAQSLAGNTEILGALSGEASGPWVDAVTGALAAETAGVEGQGEALSSNQAMLRAMRHENGVSPDAGLALKRLQTDGGRALPDPVKSKMETAFGHDFSHVRIHTDAAAKDASREVSAHAFAMGPDIYFGAGEFRPGSAEGDKLIAHELTHVVQADEGRLPSGGGVSKPTDAAEVEAYHNEDIILDRIAAPEVEAASPEAEVGAAAPAVATEEASAGKESAESAAVMRSEDAESQAGAVFGLDPKDENGNSAFREKLYAYLDWDKAEAVGAIEAWYLNDLPGLYQAELLGQPVIVLQNAAKEAGEVCQDLFGFIGQLPLYQEGDGETEDAGQQQDGESQEQDWESQEQDGESQEQDWESQEQESAEEGPKATKEELEEFDLLKRLADAHIGKTATINALVYAPLLAKGMQWATMYTERLADVELMRSTEARTRSIEAALRRAEEKRAALITEKATQLPETVFKVLTSKYVEAAAVGGLVAIGVTCPLLLATGAILTGYGYGKFFDSPDLGKTLKQVRAGETKKIFTAYEAAEQRVALKSAMGQVKDVAAAINKVLKGAEIAAAGVELVHAFKQDLDQVNEEIARWEEIWPQVEAAYKERMNQVLGNHAQMVKLAEGIAKAEKELLGYQKTIDKLGGGA